MGDGCVWRGMVGDGWGWRGMDADGRARLALSCSRDEMSVDGCAGFVSVTSLSLVVDKVLLTWRWIVLTEMRRQGTGCAADRSWFISSESDPGGPECRTFGDSGVFGGVLVVRRALFGDEASAEQHNWER